jgi:hypothetical protein
MTLSNRERDYLDTLRGRCDVLRARVGDGPQTLGYLIEWRRELKALEWAIKKCRDIGEQ